MRIIRPSSSSGALGLPGVNPATGSIPRNPGAVYEVSNPTMNQVITALWWQSYYLKDEPEIADIVTVYGFCCNQDVVFDQVFTYFKHFKFMNDPNYGDFISKWRGRIKARRINPGAPIELLRDIHEMKRIGAGDCDDFTVNISAALLRANDVRASNGQPPYEIRHIYATHVGETEPEHVFVRARHPLWQEFNDGTLTATQGWQFLDVPFTNKAGQLAPNLNNSAKWQLQAVAPIVPR